MDDLGHPSPSGDHYVNRVRQLSWLELDQARERAQDRLAKDSELSFWAQDGYPRPDAFRTSADGTRQHLSDNHLFIASVLSTLELL